MLKLIMVEKKNISDAPVSENKTDNVVAGGFRNSFTKRFPNWWRWAVVVGVAALLALAISLFQMLNPQVDTQRTEQMKAQAEGFRGLSDSALSKEQAAIRFEALYGVSPKNFRTYTNATSFNDGMRQAALLGFVDLYDKAYARYQHLEQQYAKDASTNGEPFLTGYAYSAFKAGDKKKAKAIYEKLIVAIQNTKGSEDMKQARIEAIRQTEQELQL